MPLGIIAKAVFMVELMASWNYYSISRRHFPLVYDIEHQQQIAFKQQISCVFVYIYN